jgi:hypothetical protein
MASEGVFFVSEEFRVLFTQLRRPIWYRDSGWSSSREIFASYFN